MALWSTFSQYLPLYKTQHGLPLAMTFLDLENAFGSISHEIFLNVLLHYRLPQEIITYIADLYMNLTAYVKTKE